MASILFPSLLIGGVCPIQNLVWLGSEGVEAIKFWVERTLTESAREVISGNHFPRLNIVDGSTQQMGDQPWNALGCQIESGKHLLTIKLDSPHILPLKEA
tara:strand:+ start:387 stop:686 length:300 start_codon:yes stop_codon:yes gene_type:complete